MKRSDLPEGSVTERAVRMAFNCEYMVPIEVAWGLEQRLNRATAECERLRFVSRSQDKAFDHLAQTCGKLARGVKEAAQ